MDLTKLTVVFDLLQNDTVPTKMQTTEQSDTFFISMLYYSSIAHPCDTHLWLHLLTYVGSRETVGEGQTCSREQLVLLCGMLLGSSFIGIFKQWMYSACLYVGLGLARFYTNSPGAEKFRPASLSVANNILSPVLRPRAMFLKRFVIRFVNTRC